MKKLDLENYGLVEMNSMELLEVNGGGWFDFIISVVVAAVVIVATGGAAAGIVVGAVIATAGALGYFGGGSEPIPIWN